MEKHKCKLCWKNFVNGRALGGHMRSHMVNLPIPPKHPDKEHPGQPDSASSHSSSSSSSSSDDEPDDEGEKKISMADPEFSSSVVLQDRESETESSKNPTRKRSRLTRKPGYISLRQTQRNQTKEEEQVSAERTKRRPRPSQLTESWTEPEPVSSVSDAATTEEDVAFCLMMLSRDKWGKRQVEKNQAQEQESEFEDTDEFDGSKKKKRYYKCETCDKVFKSYQALGGHRASHKKNRASEPVAVAVSVQEQETTSCPTEKKRIHECPICLRVFSSGQALGGHKRSHAAGLITSETSPAKDSLRRESLIDLNLPAPVEDDDLISAVSHA